MFEFIDMIIVRPIANLLFIIYNTVGDFGLAIIIFTILVKLLMWPLMKRQLHQNKLMKKLQPELAEIKKRCKGNRQMESLQTMDLYKKYNVKPFASILTLIIQIPIFIALYTAIRVMVLPQPTDNLATRAYPAIAEMSQIDEVIDLQKPYLESIEAGNPATYEFHPQLFGVVNLDAYARDFSSASGIFILLCAILAAVLQYYTTKMQLPSKKSKKSKGFRTLMKEAAAGKDLEQADMSEMMSSQMGVTMPIMLFVIMLALPGALVFYYLLTNVITCIQQTIIFRRNQDEMDALADKAIIKELKTIKEGKVVESTKNKKTGTTVTRIKARDIKKKGT